MSVSAAQIRQFAVASCSYCARTSGRGMEDFERQRAALYAAFAADGAALDLLGQISRAAQTVTDTRRYFQNHQLDSRANADFRAATERLAALTDRLAGHVERQT